jgi:hypothetical protein
MLLAMTPAASRLLHSLSSLPCHPDVGRISGLYWENRCWLWCCFNLFLKRLSEMRFPAGGMPGRIKSSVFSQTTILRSLVPRDDKQESLYHAIVQENSNFYSHRTNPSTGLRVTAYLKFTMEFSPQAFPTSPAPYCGFTSLVNDYSLSAAIPAQ